MKALVLFSGGLDSSTLLAMCVEKYGSENVTALSLSYGQKHDREIKSAEAVAQYYGVEHIKMDVQEAFKDSDCTLLKGRSDIPEESYAEQLKQTDGDPVSTYVPFRNGLFLAIAASMAISRGCGEIYYGAHADDAAGNAYPDCSITFCEMMDKAVYEGTAGKVRICAPFIMENKAAIVAEGIRLGVPYELTWSCYNGGEKPCGKCGTCIDRAKAFEVNGITDPLIK